MVLCSDRFLLGVFPTQSTLVFIKLAELRRNSFKLSRRRQNASDGAKG